MPTLELLLELVLQRRTLEDVVDDLDPLHDLPIPTPRLFVHFDQGNTLDHKLAAKFYVEVRQQAVLE